MYIRIIVVAGYMLCSYSPLTHKLCCRHESDSGYHLECNLSVHIYQVHNNRHVRRKSVRERINLMGNSKSYRCTEFDFCQKVECMLFTDLTVDSQSGRQAFSYSGGKSSNIHMGRENCNDSFKLLLMYLALPSSTSGYFLQ